MRKTESRKLDSFIFYNGPSQIDGQNIIGVAIGLKTASSNRKTGAMVQTYILRSDIDPLEAVRQEKDFSICGDCPHRKKTCYVDKAKGPSQVFKKFSRGGYQTVSLETASETLQSYSVRVGTYGDPYAIPFSVWSVLLSKVTKKTGYSHQWKQEDAQDYKVFCMASCDTEEEASKAVSLGWRVFLVTPKDTDRPKLEKSFLCPASEEAGKKLTCSDCLACDGTASGRSASVYIPVHGLSWKQESFKQTLIQIHKASIS